MRTDVSITLPTPGNAKAEVLSESLRGQARDKERMKNATQEFESLLLEQMVKSMRDTVPKSALFGDDPGRGLFNEMLDGEFVRLMSNRGGIGLADYMARSLADHQIKH